MEYTHGTTNQDKADATVVVNKAVGGSSIGNWALSLNRDKTIYILDLKITTGNHAGSLNVAVERGTWAWRSDLSTGYACGVGHTMRNRLTYNDQLGTWARLCWTDNNARNAAEPDGPFAGSYLYGFFFQTLGLGDTSSVQISALPNAKYWESGPGGPHSIISLGSEGWMAVGFGPVPDNTTTNRRRLPQDVYRTERIALAINQLPKSSNECGATFPYNNYGRVKDDDKCNWKYLTDLPGHSEWTFDGVKGVSRTGAAELAPGRAPPRLCRPCPEVHRRAESPPPAHPPALPPKLNSIERYR